MILLFALVVTVGSGFFLWKSRRNYLLLPELPRCDEVFCPDLSIVIPARNEAHQINRAVDSFPNLDVIVVDDLSSDHTAAVARNAGARVISAPSLASGALGKPSACAYGAGQTVAKWILFVDADTWFEPEFARSLVRYAEGEALDMVSTFLRQHCVTFAERAILPYSFALYFAGVHATRVNSAESSEVLANGQCLLVKRAAYERIGGHSRVLHSVIEDIALGRLAKRNGLRCRVIRAEQLGHVRMYSSFRTILRGFEKNSFRFLLENPMTGLQVITASVCLTSWLPALALLVIALSEKHLSILPAFLTAAAAVSTPIVGLLPWYAGGCGAIQQKLLLIPSGIYLFQLIALNGMFSTITRRRVIWKGRHV